MIRVTLAEEPAEFHMKVRVPGLRAIAEMVGERPLPSSGIKRAKKANHREEIASKNFPTYWREVLDELMDRYDRICAYSCFRIHPVTGGRSVDHMIAKSKRWDCVYEWSNYRLASARLNSRKRDFEDVLDPFEINDNWFCLELVGFQVIPSAELDTRTSVQVRDTIDRLGLNDFRQDRERDAENYWQKKVSLCMLAEESPFVARELRRQGRLNLGDV